MPHLLAFSLSSSSSSSSSSNKHSHLHPRTIIKILPISLQLPLIFSFAPVSTQVPPRMIHPFALQMWNYVDDRAIDPILCSDADLHAATFVYNNNIQQQYSTTTFNNNIIPSLRS
jgi:hypothetical protein